MGIGGKIPRDTWELYTDKMATLAPDILEKFLKQIAVLKSGTFYALSCIKMCNKSTKDTVTYNLVDEFSISSIGI